MKNKKNTNYIVYKKYNKTLRIMKISALLIFISAFNLLAENTYSQGKYNSLKIGKTNTIENIISEIEKATDYVFIYNEDVIPALKNEVNVDMNDQSLDEILNQLIKGSGLGYKLSSKQITLYKNATKNESVEPKLLDQLKAQQQSKKTITGIIVDERGEPIIGANIIEKGTSNGTITDIDGNFSLNIDNNSSLRVSYIGYLEQEINMDGKTTINIMLKEDTKTLDELVVVGYGIMKKANLTGAVDQVTGDVFENRTMTNLTQGLKGVMPNLNITLPDGRPNQSPSYNIRGATSIGQGGDALVLIDGVEGDPSLINPNDIESISLLKDAASASIYGARGVFGVVLITTKNPSKERTSVTYNASFSIKNPVIIPDYVWDGYTWAKMFNESTYNWEGSYPSQANKTIRFSQEYLEDLKYRSEHPDEFSQDWAIDPTNGEYVYYSSTNWYDELYKKNTTANEHNISVSGGSKAASYMVSGRYMGQKGIFKYNSDDYEMLNFRAKGSIQLFSWLNVLNNTQYSDMTYHTPLNVGEGTGIFRNISDEGNPMTPMFNPDGTLTHTSAYQVGDMWYGKNGYDNIKSVFKNTTDFTAKFLDDKLHLKGDFTFQTTNDNEKRKRVPIPYDKSPGVTSYVGTSTNDLREISRETKYNAFNIYSEFENIYNESHYFKIMLGYNYEESQYKKLEATRNGLIFEDAQDLNLALGDGISVSGGNTKWNIQGGFSRINYSFKDRYLIEINARYDGSSKFPSNERYALFPSFSVGWRLSEESFWRVSKDIISSLKFRGSYGSLGNGNIAAYLYQEIFNINQSDNILGGNKPQKTSRPSVIPDGLTWETATTVNIGIDMSLISDRLVFVGDIYQRNTTDMFTIGMTLPAVFGATSPKGNYADMETKGWEASLSWRDSFFLSSKPFGYKIGFTIADNKSIITKYNNPEKNLDDYYEGMVVGELWGYTNDGFFIDQADINNHADQSRFKSTNAGVYFPGDIKFKDINGDGKINPGTNRVDNPGDRKIIGNTSPRFTYGINLSADWSNFFLSTFFQGVGKQDWWPNGEASVFWGHYNRPYNYLPRWHLDNHWTPENTDAYMPRYVGRIANRSGGVFTDNPQTKYLQNIAYIRLKNIQVGYNIPIDIASKIGANNVRVYFSGENIWTWSPLYKITKDIDVENTGPSDLKLSDGKAGDGYNYPMLKSLSFGLSVTF